MVTATRRPHRRRRWRQKQSSGRSCGARVQPPLSSPLQVPPTRRRPREQAPRLRRRRAWSSRRRCPSCAPRGTRGGRPAAKDAAGERLSPVPTAGWPRISALCSPRTHRADVLRAREEAEADAGAVAGPEELSVHANLQSRGEMGGKRLASAAAGAGGSRREGLRPPARAHHGGGLADDLAVDHRLVPRLDGGGVGEDRNLCVELPAGGTRERKGVRRSPRGLVKRGKAKEHTLGRRRERGSGGAPRRLWAERRVREDHALADCGPLHLLQRDRGGLAGNHLRRASARGSVKFLLRRAHEGAVRRKEGRCRAPGAYSPGRRASAYSGCSSPPWPGTSRRRSPGPGGSSGSRGSRRT